MGAWGTAIFSDDLAADVRGDFRDYIGDGLSVEKATARLRKEYADALDDDEDAPVFWLALAVSQWQLVRVHEPTRNKALKIIASGRDLERWDTPKERKQREAVLAAAAEQLTSPPPPAKKVPKPHRETNTWEVGEVLALGLKSGRWTLVRVVGHHEDKGGRLGVVEVLNWIGDVIPCHEEIDKLDFLTARPPHQHLTQFFLLEPRVKKYQLRLQRLGFSSPPKQTCGSFSGLIWNCMDRQLEEFFGMA
jgi:hypothetical protein